MNMMNDRHRTSISVLKQSRRHAVKSCVRVGKLYVGILSVQIKVLFYIVILCVGESSEVIIAGKIR